MKRVSRFSFFILIAGILSGCIPRGCLDLSLRPPIAVVYSHTTEPLDTNMNRTPVGERTEKGGIKHLEYNIGVTWDSNAIGEIAKENGIEKIFFADVENICFLGLWRQRIVHIYGE